MRQVPSWPRCSVMGGPGSVHCVSTSLAGLLAIPSAVGGPADPAGVAPNHGARPKYVLTPGNAPACNSGGRIEPVPVSPKKQGGTWYSAGSWDSGRPLPCPNGGSRSDDGVVGQ